MKNYNSELIVWSNTFSSGISMIDEQHKKLINLINSLFLHTSGNQDLERYHFCLVIDEVINFIKIHLATEEKILIAIKYPDYAQHERAHKTFFTTILDVTEDYKAGKHHTLASIFSYLKNWALSHIAIMDKDYFDYIKKIAIRNPDGRWIIPMKDIEENIILQKKAG